MFKKQPYKRPKSINNTIHALGTLQILHWQFLSMLPAAGVIFAVAFWIILLVADNVLGYV